MPKGNTHQPTQIVKAINTNQPIALSMVVDAAKPNQEGIMMIDTIGYTSQMTRKLLKAALPHNKNSYSRFWVWVPTRFGRFKIIVNVDEQTMTMELSPMMHLVGHNVFGTNHLENLIFGVLELIYSHFQLPFTDREKEFYIEKGFEMSRVDLTASFLVGSQNKIFDTMDLLSEHLLDHGYHIVKHEGPDGVETVYVSKSSSRSTVKFYNKYREMLAKGKAVGLPYFQELLRYVEKLLRYELTLRTPHLKYHGLEHSKSWTISKVRELLERQLHELGFSGQLLAELPDDVVEGLSPEKRSKYSLWVVGNDMRKHFPPHTLARDRKLFLQHGIDFGRTHADAQDAVLLSERLSVEKMRMTWPKKFVPLGAVYLRDY